MPESNGSKSKSDWLESTYAKSVARAPERDYPFDTSDGALVEPLYAPEDMDGWDYLSQLSFPGEFPYTRGVQPTMYRGRLWTMRQYAGFGDAEESNARYRYLLGQGQTGLSVAFDLPTQIGYDSDHPMAEGEVGKVGVAISSLADMELLMKEIPLEKATTSMTINATGSILLAFYVAVAKKQGADLSKIGGTTQNDILKEYIARGTYIFPPEGSMRLITDVFGWCKDNLPAWNTISISGYHMREAGCTAIQEVAFTFANAIAYVEAALKAGLEFDEFALPTEKAVQIALRTQQIIAYESGVADVIDPFGGAYYVEKLTDHIEEEATRYLDRIEDIGGALRAIEMGYQQREIQEASYRYQMSVDNGHRTVVGVNEFRSDDEEHPEILRVRHEVVRRQIDRLNRVRAERDNAKVDSLLKLLEDAARSETNLMPVFIECVENYVTIGEICRVLRGVFGEQREFHVF